MNCNRRSKKYINIIKKKEQEIVALKKKIRSLNKQVNIDGMMKIYNKRKGIAQLKMNIKESIKTQGPLSICFIDIDNLKQVNDYYGHHQGDKLLVTISNLIKGSIRKGDTVFRFGGDEIVVVFPKTTVKEAKTIWKRVDNTLANLNAKTELPFSLSISKGFAQYDLYNNMSPQQLIKEADKKMYKEKNSKKKEI